MVPIPPQSAGLGPASGWRLNLEPLHPCERGHCPGITFPRSSHVHARHYRPVRPASPPACIGRVHRRHHAAGARLPSLARGPENIADVAEKVIDAVVNISTSQNVECAQRGQHAASCRNDPQLDELFRDFFNRRGQRRAEEPQRAPPRRVNSLGSGFIIDASGIVVTNNHVIAEADEITVILNDGSRAQGRADRPRSEDRHRAAAGQDRQAAQGGASSAIPTSCGSANG